MEKNIIEKLADQIDNIKNYDESLDVSGMHYISNPDQEYQFFVREENQWNKSDQNNLFHFAIPNQKKQSQAQLEEHAYYFFPCDEVVYDYESYYVNSWLSKLEKLFSQNDISYTIEENNEKPIFKNQKMDEYWDLSFRYHPNLNVLNRTQYVCGLYYASVQSKKEKIEIKSKEDYFSFCDQVEQKDYSKYLIDESGNFEMGIEDYHFLKNRSHIIENGDIFYHFLKDQYCGLELFKVIESLKKTITLINQSIPYIKIDRVKDIEWICNYAYLTLGDTEKGTIQKILLEYVLDHCYHFEDQDYLDMKKVKNLFLQLKTSFLIPKELRDSFFYQYLGETIINIRNLYWRENENMISIPLYQKSKTKEPK